MDLSTRAAKRLRLDDFLKQNLVEAPARYLIEWVDSREGIFRILWTHQSSGDFNAGDAALFRYWAIARGECLRARSVARFWCICVKLG